MNIHTAERVVSVLSASLSALNDLDDEQDDVLEGCKRVFTPLEISVILMDEHCAGIDTVHVTVDQMGAVSIYRETASASSA